MVRDRKSQVRSTSLDVAAMVCAVVFALNFCVEALTLFDETRSRLVLTIGLGIVLSAWAVVEVVLHARTHRDIPNRRLLALTCIQLAVECGRMAIQLWGPDAGLIRTAGVDTFDATVGIFLLPVYLLVFLAILRAVLANHTAELRRLATTDGLTGAFNRRHLEARLRERTGNARNPTSLMLIDIDNFKHVNDAYGHRVGDSVLIELTRLLQSNTRACDPIGRWGGEEFAVLLGNCGLAEARVVAEELRSLIAEHEFADCRQVTASIGVAESRSGEEFETWFQRADAALYRAKESGRNAVVAE